MFINDEIRPSFSGWWDLSIRRLTFELGLHMASLVFTWWGWFSHGECDQLDQLAPSRYCDGSLQGGSVDHLLRFTFVFFACGLSSSISFFASGAELPAQFSADVFVSSGVIFLASCQDGMVFRTITSLARFMKYCFALLNAVNQYNSTKVLVSGQHTRFKRMIKCRSEILIPLYLPILDPRREEVL